MIRILGFNGEGFIECLKQLLRIDGSWIPQQEGYAMYIRPAAIGMAPVLGVHASEKARSGVMKCYVTCIVLCFVKSH